MNVASILLSLVVTGCAVSPPDQITQERGGGGGGAATPYLGFLDELSRPGLSIDTDIRAGMPDARIFWATGNPVPTGITVTSALPGGVTVGAGDFTFPAGERQHTNPTGFRVPVTFELPRAAIGQTFEVSASTRNANGTGTSTQLVTVVDAPSTPTGVTVTKVGTDLVVSWAPSQFGLGPIHYIVEDLTCVTRRVCDGVIVADTAATTVTYTRTGLVLRIRAVADNADSNVFEMDTSTF